MKKQAAVRNANMNVVQPIKVGDDCLESRDELNNGKEGFIDSVSCGKKYSYCVLYTQVLKQWEVCEVIRKSLPEGRGTVFYPCVELWWNDTVDTVIRPLFPGYVFIRSDLERAELHDLIVRRRKDILLFIKELKLSELKNAGGVPVDMDDALLIDIKEDEAEFLDFILNFKYREDGEEEAACSSAVEAKCVGQTPAEEKCMRQTLAEAEGERQPAGEKARNRKTTKIPEEGVIRMSYGYCENGKYVVMEGPLRGYEDRIVSVDRRKRKAYLDIEINGHMAKAGLGLMGKGYWFPKDKCVPAVLEDGTEIDPAEIAKKMMSGSR